MTNVIGNISESILEHEWNLDFYLKMAKQAFESSDYDQANNLIEKGKEIAIKTNNIKYIKKFNNLGNELNKNQEVDSNLFFKNSELLKIKGIGISLAKKLFNAGFKSIIQLSETTPIVLSQIKGISFNNAQNFIKLSQKYLNIKTISNINEDTNDEKRELPDENKDVPKEIIPIKNDKKRIEIEKEFIRKGYNLINTISDIPGYDIFAIKEKNITKEESIIFLIPVRISDLDEPVIISENDITIANIKQNQDILEHIQFEIDTLKETQRISYLNLYENGSLYRYLHKYLNTNFKVEFKSHTDLYFYSDSIEYKILISPIFICEQTPKSIEKIIPFPYQRSSNIHYIMKDDISELLNFIENQYFLIHKYEGNKKKVKSKIDYNSELINTLQKYSLPFFAIGVIIYLIYPLMLDYIKIIIGIGSSIIFIYSILLIYYYINYKKKINAQNKQSRSIINQKEINLDEIDIELISQELNKKEMDQFIYECFGKEHQFDKLIHKNIEISNIDRKRENDTIKKKPIITQREKLIKKYIDFLED